MQSANVGYLYDNDYILDYSEYTGSKLSDINTECYASYPDVYCQFDASNLMRYFTAGKECNNNRDSTYIKESEKTYESVGDLKTLAECIMYSPKMFHTLYFQHYSLQNGIASLMADIITTGHVHRIKFMIGGIDKKASDTIYNAIVSDKSRVSEFYIECHNEGKDFRETMEFEKKCVEGIRGRQTECEQCVKLKQEIVTDTGSFNN